MTCIYCGASPEQVTASWQIIIGVCIPSQNVLSANKGPQRWAYKQTREDFTWALFHGAKDIPYAVRKRRAVITRVYSGKERKYDHANLVGGAKALVDAMVARRLLKDDAPDWFDGFYRQERGDESETRITLEELA